MIGYVLRILVLRVSIGVLLTFVFLVEYRDGCRAESREKERRLLYLAQRRHAPRELAESWIHLGFAHPR